MHTLVIVLLLMACVDAAGQQSLNSKKKELQRLGASITATQKKIQELENLEKSKKRSLSSYQKQRHQIAVFIATLERELTALQDSARVLSVQIVETRNALNAAEQAYEQASHNLVRWKSEHRGLPESTATRDALFRQLTASLTTYRNEMTELRDSLMAQEDVLEEYSATQERVLGAKAHEEQTLKATISKSSKELARVRSNQIELTQQLKQKQQSAQRLRNLISDLVKKEMERKEMQRKQRAKKDGAKPEPRPTDQSVAGFARNSLPWPTASHTILQGYGAYKNPTTGTTLENPGVDIKAKTGSPVSCVAKGEVSSVTFLPGLGSLVIVDHGNGVRTVYANLSAVSVAKGATVNQGTRIGTSGENIDGELVHFEVWNGRSRKDPMMYLK